MVNFFPDGFWPTVALIGTGIFFVFGVDLLFGAKFMRFLGTLVNKKYQVDQAIVNVLQELKKVSDREYDVEQSLMYGWGRFVLSGVLFFSAIMLVVHLLPRLK